MYKDYLLYKLLIYNLYKIDCKDYLSILLDNLNIISLQDPHKTILYILRTIPKIDHVYSVYDLENIIYMLESNGHSILINSNLEYIIRIILTDENYEEKLKFIYG